MTLIEIKSAIQQLPQQEARKLADWLQNYVEDQWDRQIESDAKLGKLDSLIAEAEAAIKAGKTKSLFEVIN